MMRLISQIFSLTCVALLLSLNQSKAQSSDVFIERDPRFTIQNQYRQKYTYKYWLNRAQIHKSGQFPFDQLVEAYTKGPDYDPYAESALNQIYEYAFTAQTSEDEQDVQDAIDRFKMLLEDHMGHFDILNAAVTLTRENEKLGDLEFLEWFRGGLARRALNSGRGIDIHTAYRIFTPGEENFILRHLKVNLTETETLTDGDNFYHIHSVEDPFTGRPGKIYMNFSAIMQAIIQNKQINDPQYRYQPAPFE